MGQCMGLPVGAANSGIPIPFESPINAARSSATATQNSSVQIVTRRYRYDHDSSLPRLDSVNYGSKPGGTPAALEKWQRVKIREESESINALNRVMEEGNPEGKSLQDLTLILTQLMLDASRNECNELSLASNHGRITLKVKFDGRANTYVPVPNNWPKEKKEKYALINDKLTLSVLRVLYGESAVNDFLSERYPGGAVSSAQRINTVQSSVTATAPPINAARSSATATQSSCLLRITGRVVTRSYMADHNLLYVDDANDCSKLYGTPEPLALMPGVKIREESELEDAWVRVIEEGNPDGKALETFTLILEELLEGLRRNRQRLLPFNSDLGRILLEIQPGECVNTYVPVSISDNCQKFKQEMHSKLTDELTLSVLQIIYGERAANDFLSGKYIGRGIDLHDNAYKGLAAPSSATVDNFSPKNCKVMNVSGAPISPRTLAKIMHRFEQAKETG